MAETLRDLVVSLPPDSDDFSANLRSINARAREADSRFNAVGAETKLSTLQLRQQAV